MSRHQRRRAAKIARDSKPDEIFPGNQHGPVQSGAAEIMTAILDTCKEALPGFEITLFVAEKDVPAGQDRLPRFNYASTACREDMYAVLAAFLEKNKHLAKTLDRIGEEPPTGAKN